MKIAIIGAGLAGLTLARLLDKQFEVTLFEKSRGVAGRMATRYASPYEFDHGAQFFTVSTPEFETFLNDHVPMLLTEWPALQAGENLQLKRYVPRGRMNALGKALAEDLNIISGIRITGLTKADTQWTLHSDESTFEGFDWVISAMPQPQMVELVQPVLELPQQIHSVEMQGCYALMLGDPNLELPDFEGKELDDDRLGWIAVNSSKPERPDASAVLVHASNDWSEHHIDADNLWVKQQLLEAIKEMLGLDYSKASHQVLHRWRYAKVTKACGEAYYPDEENRFAACGDWCLGGKVESAFQSGFALAKYLNAIDN